MSGVRWVLAGWALFLAACATEPLPPPTVNDAPVETIRLGVSSGATAVAGTITANYPAGAVLQLATANDATLLADLNAGRLDAALLHHLPAEQPNWFNPVALDGVVIIVHVDNVVIELSTAEIEAIFNGRIGSWDAVGGAVQPITLLGREPGAGAWKILRQRLMAGQPLDVDAQVQPDDDAMRAAVAEDPNAIGFSMMGNATGAAVKMVAVNGRFPTPAETAAQTYPLTVPLYFVTAGTEEPTGAVRALVAWLQSDAGQALLGQRLGRVR